MKRWIPGGLVILVLMLVVVMACAPKARTVPAPLSTPQQAVPALPTPTTSLTLEDEAWAKVVAAARKEGKLTVYSVHLVGEVAINVTQAFTKRTGLGLVYCNSNTYTIG